MATAWARLRLWWRGSIGMVTMPWHRAMSDVSNPARSPPNSRPTPRPEARSSYSTRAASRGVRTGWRVSRGRAVVAKTVFRSATAPATLSNTRIPSSTQSAPEAVAQARSCGQPSRGATSRSSDRPKLAITRATAPMFSAIWDLSRMMTGGAGSDMRRTYPVSRQGSRKAASGAPPPLSSFRRRPEPSGAEGDLFMYRRSRQLRALARRWVPGLATLPRNDDSG